MHIRTFESIGSSGDIGINTGASFTAGSSTGSLTLKTGVSGDGSSGNIGIIADSSGFQGGKLQILKQKDHSDINFLYI